MDGRARPGGDDDREKGKDEGGAGRPFRRFAPPCPPSCQPIPSHYRGRQSGHFLEIASLLLPLAALRRFPLAQGRLFLGGEWFHARTHSGRSAPCPARNPSTSLRLVPLPLGKGGNGFLGVQRKSGAGGQRRPPLHRLSVGFRRGRRPQRPGGTNFHVMRRAACPHAAVFCA